MTGRAERLAARGIAEALRIRYAHALRIMRQVRQDVTVTDSDLEEKCRAALDKERWMHSES
jgi:hypothetical protein